MPRKRYWKKARVSKGPDASKILCEEDTIAHEVNEAYHDKRSSRKEVPDKLSTVFGSFHQGHNQFGENNGKQCVANSCSAICYDLIKQVDLWNGCDLNGILWTGDGLYSLVKPRLPKGEIYLLLTELPEVVKLFNRTFFLTLGTTVSGLVVGNMDPGMECDVIMSLDKALKSTLSGFNSCFVTFKKSTFAVICRSQVLHIFDSHSRNGDGVQADDGSSVVIKYTSVEQVYDHCLRLAVSLNADQVIRFVCETIQKDFLTTLG